MVFGHRFVQVSHINLTFQALHGHAYRIKTLSALLFSNRDLHTLDDSVVTSHERAEVCGWGMENLLRFPRHSQYIHQFLKIFRLLHWLGYRRRTVYAISLILRWASFPFLQLQIQLYFALSNLFQGYGSHDPSKWQKLPSYSNRAKSAVQCWLCYLSWWEGATVAFMLVAYTCFRCRKEINMVFCWIETPGQSHLRNTKVSGTNFACCQPRHLSQFTRVMSCW